MTFRIVCTAILAGLITWLTVTVLRWRADAALLPQVRAEFAAYREDVERQAAERERRERISREVEQSYVAIINQQSEDLRVAREQLRNVRLHVGTCSNMPAAAEAAPAPGGADAESDDGQSGLVAADVAERLSACDATGARLNALIEWIERQTG